MVPSTYNVFFTTMAAAGATLFGLIFVAISIAPESVTGATSAVDRQIRASAAYVALLNPLMISLFALVPYQVLGVAVTVISWVGIINSLAISITLFQGSREANGKVRNIVIIFASLILYGFEAYVGMQLDRLVVDNYWFSVLADVLIFITLFGIIRAWELIGVRQFRMRDWFSIVIAGKKRRAENRVGDAEVDEDKLEDQNG